ncbi:hypothetical protein CUJ84_Chr001098 [Rhizobium leguminosarum]|uniref:Uncharacterized protein n=1 Tax=Rhizobium leguminosarum TaxID=384 RepID=A0A2K9YZW1_RHILE|nr:hypothetical protein CUJ84_Chr001098 [Rhizobium leguminosarum]
MPARLATGVNAMLKYEEYPSLTPY